MNDENPYSASSHELQSGDDDGRKRWPSIIGFALAIALGCVVQLIASKDHYFSSVQPSLKAIGFVLDLCQGALAGVGLHALSRAIMNRQFGALMPGHWLAVSQFAVVVGTICSWCVPIHLGRYVNDPKALVFAFVANFGGAVFFVAVGLLTRESQVWRIYAWLNVALYIGYLLRLPLAAGGQFAFTYETPPSPFATVTLAAMTLAMWAARLTLVIGVVQDWRQRTRRDLPHWLGLILGTIGASATFISRIFVMMPIV